MKVAQLVSKRFKETPADCQIISQALMMRGGYMKPVGTGIYSLFPAAQRIMRKIESIIREEMDAIDGQEVLFPVTMPAALWRESGRYDAIGSELLRFTDRSGNDMVLGMTHEEASVQLVRDWAESYAQYPFMIYQIQTKFRDEPRTRGGLIRVREFTMKDAYSFHTSQEDLEQTYQRCFRAYERIFARVGLPQVIAVASDSGMMGGSASHEFMLPTEAGEDTLVLCPDCGYRANMEAAPCITSSASKGDPSPLQSVHTPGIKTIEALCEFLNIQPIQTCKAVVYQVNETDEYIVVFLRGDLEVNETKLRNHLGCEIHPALDLDESSGLTAGFIGPLGLPGQLRMVFDQSLQGEYNLVCGGNQPDTHTTGFNPSRDLPAAQYADVAKACEGGLCPCCGHPSLTLTRGIEVGNIFQLGDKYTKSMDMRYTDPEGRQRFPLMGCYGIGIGRLAASICEASHDEYGPIWPISVAPWPVELCALRSDHPEVREAADGLYRDLTSRGIDVLYDDRQVSAGVMFSDADLLAAPLRVIISPKGLKNGSAELTSRDKQLKAYLPLQDAADRIQDLLRQAMDSLEAQAPARI